ncbi:MAG: MotA/TolQ/ExbB proton channel family protein [Thermodesulfobacteriota bacterium]|nr:MotA/TolQ/ExbB proton channel family protein [Thermodesulfobacteriota bacterium]
MDILLNLFRSHATVASSIIQYLVYTTSAILFLNGLWGSVKAFRWLRKMKPEHLKMHANGPVYTDDPLMLVIYKTFSAAKKEYGSNSSRLVFVADATRQMAENLFESRYLESINMSANLLPPLGFIGTVFGMILIFLAKVEPGSELNTIGLGAALFTTLVALILFVMLELIKMGLARLIKKRIELGLNQDPGPEGE